MSYRGIAERLNLDPQQYPPPEPPDPARAAGRWLPAAVRSLLANPKYTGYMVWNRRARSRGNIHLPTDEWVCSSTPTHPAIITVEAFQQAAQVAPRRRGSRTTPGPNRAHPNNVGRSYLLRGYVFCAICGYRMHGRLTCPVFLTGPEFLPELREQRHRTLTLIDVSTSKGHTRVAEMNQQVLTNLDRMIGELDTGTEATVAG
jgi:hypothetical protein